MSTAMGSAELGALSHCFAGQRRSVAAAFVLQEIAVLEIWGCPAPRLVGIQRCSRSACSGNGQ
eukprot:13081804-Alexandrium_andersonii.AAC.1